MSPRRRAHLKAYRPGWIPRLNDVVYLPDRKPFRRSARGRVVYAASPLVVVAYFAHGARCEYPFEPKELRPCKGRCRIPEIRKG